MIIHIVQQGDSLASIANQYNISETRLIQDNGLEARSILVPGQTIVIAYPEKTHTVQEGDSLIKIAESNDITLIQLLRNNPYLSDREYIFPGESLVISYNNNKGKITTNGYANTFINRDTLRRTLPFLTYLSIFGYRTSDEGEIIGVDDSEIIQLAKEYKVAPIMLVSSMTSQGIGSLEISYKLLYNQNYVDRHIENILLFIKRKGFYGVNVTYQFISEENREIYENYTRKLFMRLKREGYLVFITISGNFIIDADKVTFEKIDFTNISPFTDGITLLNYNWGYSYGPPGPVTSVYMMKKFIDYIIQSIPPQKIEIGIPIIGYDWELPYVIGVTRASSLTLDSAITLAGNVGATIQFDEVSQTPYFRYVDDTLGIPRRHIVWFIDARSIDATLKLVDEYGFRGIGIWNIMNYYQQMWLTTNSQYEIETLLT